jgi:PKD repeat protein
MLSVAPVAKITAAQYSSNLFRFNAYASSGERIVQDVWRFGDGTTAKGPDVFHTFATNGEYRVKLTVTDKHHVSDSESITFTAGSKTKTASISGVVFQDKDGDGKRGPDEGGVSGATLWVDADNDGVQDANERSTKSAYAGEYALLNLKGGDVVVRVASPNSFFLTTGISGMRVKLANGAAVRSQNVGAQPGGRIAGGVYFDDEGDGSGDPLEAFNAQVFLDDNNNGKRDSGERVTSTSSQKYAFDGVSPGTHYVRPVITDTVYVTSAVTSARVVVTSGKTTSVPAFSVSFAGATISGTIWNDVAKNGVRDSNDHGLANISLMLDANANGKADASERRTVTTAAGHFSFTSVRPGQYHVIVLASNYETTFPSEPRDLTVHAFSEDEFTSIGLAKR